MIRLMVSWRGYNVSCVRSHGQSSPYLHQVWTIECGWYGETEYVEGAEMRQRVEEPTDETEEIVQDAEWRWQREQHRGDDA